MLTLHKLSSLTFLQPNRKKVAKSTSKTLIEEWKNRFTLVPNDIAKKKLENTTQMEIKIDIDNSGQSPEGFSQKKPLICILDMHSSSINEDDMKTTVVMKNN